MKPAPFKYLVAKSVDDAVAALVQHPDAKLLAGGQSLVPMMNFRLVKPAWLIDINRIADLKGIRPEGDRILIGAMTRHVELEQSASLQERVPLISEAVRLIGHTAIRNRGTIGGSISHADPAANLPVALLALDGVIHVRGPNGPRSIAAEDLFTGLFTTTLASDEIVTAIEIVAIADAEGCAFEEFSRRHGDFGLASTAVRLRLRTGKIEGAPRIALGGVGDHAVRARRAEALLQDAAPSDAAFQAAADEAAREIDPPTDIHGSADYRRSLVRSLVKTALVRAVERANNNH